MITAATHPVEWALLAYDLTDAHEALGTLIDAMHEAGEIDEIEYGIDLAHVYAHLNQAWNARHHEGERSSRDLDRYAAFPTDLRPYGGLVLDDEPEAPEPGERVYDLVEHRRPDLDDTFTLGFVVADDDAWIVLNVVDDLVLDGYAAFRRFPDDETFHVEDDKAALVHRILDARGLHPARPDWLRLGALPELLDRIQHHTDVVVLHHEHVWPDECLIGRATQRDDDTYELLCLEPLATWDLDHRTHRYEHITQISWGAAYETGLMLAAPPRPGTSSAS